MHFIEKNESECIYDQFYSNNIISDKPLCIIRCAFKSIKSLQENGAVYIFIKNKYEQNIFFDNCSFIECYSKRGSGININLTKICTVQIYNSMFYNNTASLTGGAVYFNSQVKSNLELENCLFKLNSAKYYSGSLYTKLINYSIKNCEFADNYLNLNKISEGAGIFSSTSESLLFNCTFINNKAYSNENHAYGSAISFYKTDGSLKIALL